MTQQREDFINQFLSLLNSSTVVFKMVPTGSIFFNVAQTFLIWQKWWCKKRNIQGELCKEYLSFFVGYRCMLKSEMTPSPLCRLKCTNIKAESHGIKDSFQGNYTQLT